MIARGVRNVIYNYTDAQRKVRSATSNDAWGPSPALMHEIADLTDNVVAYSEIMPIIWKRLNDHGKNWRHVYKSLVLLDHLIKYGNERVAQQCKENIFSIQTLKDFQYVEDQKDQGYNVREKAKQLIALLKDDERLRNERRKAQEGREHYVRQAIGMDSNGSVTYGRPTAGPSMRRNSLEGTDPYGSSQHHSSHGATSYPTANRSTSYNDNLRGAMPKDFVVPASQEEEQLQMQIALAESQREAEDEERRRRNDDLKLRIALERSVNEGKTDTNPNQPFDTTNNSQRLDPSLFDTYPNTSNPYPSAVTTNSAIPWAVADTRSSSQLGFAAVSNDPWSTTDTTNRNASTWQPTASANPWGGNNQTTNNHPDTGLSINMGDPWGLGLSSNNRSTPSTSALSPPAPIPAQTSSKSLIDNELSEFFGNNATISTTNMYQQPAPVSSNPWNISSSSTTTTTTTTMNNYQSSPIATGSISPPMSNLTMSGGNLLYPTIASGASSSPTNINSMAATLAASRKTPESFLGDQFSTLVNLDKLVPDPKATTNPFGNTGAAARTANPFSAATKAPTLDQLSTSNTPTFSSGPTLPPPLIPSTYNGNTSTIPPFNNNNPFL